MKHSYAVLLFSAVLGLAACSETPEVASLHPDYFVKRFSRYIAMNAGAFGSIDGSWSCGYRYGSYTLDMNTNGRFTFCHTTCIGSYVTYGGWIRNERNVELSGDSGNAYSAYTKPVVLNNDANIFHDTVIVYRDRMNFHLQNDTLFASDTSVKLCALIKCKGLIPEGENPFMK